MQICSNYITYLYSVMHHIYILCIIYIYIMYVDVDPCCDGGILVVSMKFGVEKLIKPATLHWSIGPKMMDPEVSGKNPTLPETNSSPLKMDGLNTTFLLGRPIFRGYVSFREGKLVSLFKFSRHFLVF